MYVNLFVCCFPYSLNLKKKPLSNNICRDKDVATATVSKHLQLSFVFPGDSSTTFYSDRNNERISEGVREYWKLMKNCDASPDW